MLTNSAGRASLCLDSPRIHQQSRERARRYPAELGHWNSSQSSGRQETCRKSANTQLMFLNREKDPTFTD